MGKTAGLRGIVRSPTCATGHTSAGMPSTWSVISSPRRLQLWRRGRRRLSHAYALPESAHGGYDDLISRAVVVHRLAYVESTSQSHMDASIDMLKHADRLFAVWDGLPARSFGGTADVVSHAREIGVPVTVIWPEGAQRS